MKPVYFSNSEFTVIYTQDIHKNIHTTSLEFTVHIYNIEKFNSQIIYSQQYSQHRSKYNIHNMGHQYSRCFQVYQ
jgi:hypothetical protein